MRRIRENDADHVDIGVHADEGAELVKIASAHEFGANISHPGGTEYGYATSDEAKKHQVRFLKKGQGYLVLGVTRPHQIVIPMRSYIRSTMDENAEKYHQLGSGLFKRILDGNLNKFLALSLIGQCIESDIKRKITTLRDPPLKPATIQRRKKRSDNPLVNTGHLRASIRYVVKSKDDPTVPIGNI